MLHAKVFIAERCCYQQLITAQAYKVQILQAQRRAILFRQDVVMFQESSSQANAESEINPDFSFPSGLYDMARSFPGVPDHPESGISFHISLWKNNFLKSSL
jgi:hypothetical protein